jgi:fluoride ion exporter CrcB/FEX
MSEDHFSENTRLAGTLIVVVIGIALIGLIAYNIPIKEGWKASDVTTLIGSLTTFLGTVVGSFLGLQVGAAGKQKAESLAQRALAALMPEDAARVLQQECESKKRK